jgi:hypothetical protein
MKNYKSIFFATAFLIIIASSLVYSAKTQDSETDGLIFIRSYETGWIKAIRGIYVFYPDGKREKVEVLDDLDPIGNAQKSCDLVNKIIKSGYRIIESHTLKGAGVNKDYEYTEYILEKIKQ